MRSLALLSALFGLAACAPILERQTTCNGQPSFCDRKYTNITFIGTHDSAFVGSIADPRVNQEVSLTDQLDAGIRFVQAQTHKNLDGGLDMCHTDCLLEDAGSLEGYLGTVKGWLDAEGNEGEVVTMLLVNGDNVDISLYASAFESSGLKDYAFIPSTSPNALDIDAWPTLGELISSNKRLVMFLDSGANEASVPYILSEFNAYFFETPYDTTDPTFPQCSLDRPSGANPDGRMYIMNHFLDMEVLGADVPDNMADGATNAATGVGSIGAQAAICEGLYGRAPNFVLVDMFDRGNALAAQHGLNFPEH